MADQRFDADSLYSRKHPFPDDTVSFSIFPDFSLNPSTTGGAADQLHQLHLQILQILTPYTDPYIFQHQPFTLSVATSPIPHLSGRLRYGDNIDDEWFVAFLLYAVSRRFPSLSITLHDSDGEFLLVEAAFHLPKWVEPETAVNRVFLRRGRIYLLPPSHFPGNPSLVDALKFLSENSDNPDILQATPDALRVHLKKKFKEYPQKAERNMHRVRVRLPLSVAWVLKHEPCLISLAVEGFYDRDVDSMKFADKMEKFLPGGKEEEVVQVFVKMSRAMYAQLMQQMFRPPRRYPEMPMISDVEAYREAELGMKITCGLEMMYQIRKREGEERQGSTWDAYRERLENTGYFEGLLPGSAEYKTLMEKAENYHKNSAMHSRASEMLTSPATRIDEILLLPHSVDNFKGQELPPSDDDSWLYDGDKELNAELEDRQKEMEMFDSRRKRKQKGKEAGTSDYDLGQIANSMQEFVKKMSSYKGAEVPEDRKMKDIDLDVDLFMKDLESVMKRPAFEGNAQDDLEEGSSSDMDFDDSEVDSNASEVVTEEILAAGDAFMESYSDVLNKQLKDTTLGRSFVQANDEPKKDEGTSDAAEAMEEELKPVDVDFNLVQNLLESFSSQQGLPGPGSNLLGLMGLHLPEDGGNKGK